jgi:hypothetical protein
MSLEILQITAAVMGDLAGEEAVTTRAVLGRFPSTFLSSKESLSLLSPSHFETRKMSV